MAEDQPAEGQPVRQAPVVDVATLSSWREVVEAADYLAGHGWVFRGHRQAEWILQTSLEREFGSASAEVERNLLWHFVRTAPRSLPSHLVPAELDAAAWLGLIQHYGGPTRLLDVTRSPYVALYFAFESSGGNDRALWAVDHAWCGFECARIMTANEGIPMNQAFGRTAGAQAQLVYSLVHGPYRDPLFSTFKPFTGVFPVDPWKPDVRQSAQQGMFLCTANPALSFMDNIQAHERPNVSVLRKFVLPSCLREEAIEQLALMNVTAATLFPDLTGLARSLRTHTIRRRRDANDSAPWERRPTDEPGTPPGANS